MNTPIIKDVPKGQQKCYKNRSGLKGAGVQLSFTEDQVNEYIKCSQNPIYFIRTYLKIVHIDHGLVPFDLYGYQEKFINTMHDNSKTVLCTARQVGKTMCTAAYFIWYAVFHQNKDSAILANKGGTSYEIMNKIQTMYSHIPYWLQPGLIEWNKSTMVLENGSRIFCETTSANSIRGYSISLLLLDEFAFVPTNNAEEFFTSVYPTLSSGKNTKIIIASTPCGLNHFYKTYTEACEGRNGFVPVSVKWDSVPGRDDKWAADQRRVLGDAKFLQEHEADFQGSSNTLISSYYIKNMVYLTPIHSADNFDMLEAPIKDHLYMLTVDTSRGIGNDFSAFIVFDVTTTPYKTVGKYRCDHIAPLLFPSIIREIAQKYNEAYVLVETNDLGEQVVGILHNDLEYEHIIYADRDIISEWGKCGTPGVRTTTKTKRVGCQSLKSLVENSTIIISDFETIVEISTFVMIRQSYQADSECHDDLCMCLVLFGWLAQTQWFKDFTNIDIRMKMYEAEARRLENSMIPFGFIELGQEDYHYEEEIHTPDAVWINGNQNYNDFLRERFDAMNDF